MFCDGKCFKGKKRCGLLYDIKMTNNLTNKDEIVQKCAFLHAADSQIRTEVSLLRIQKAVESSRNEQANGDHKISTVVATGFMGMLYAFNEDETKFKRSLKLLSNATQSVPEGKSV